MILIGVLLQGALRMARKLLFWLLLLAAGAKLLSFALALYAEAHRHQVEALASRLLGTPVQVAHIQTSWRGFTPKVWLRRLQVGEPQERLDLGDVLVAVDLRALPLWRHYLPLAVVLHGTRLQIVRDAQGATRILGLPRPSGGALPPAVIQVRDATLHWIDHKRDNDYRLPHVDLQWLAGAQGARLALRARDLDLELRADLQGRLTTTQWSARLWARGEGLHQLSPLHPYLPQGLILDDSRLSFELWSQWRQGRHHHSRLRLELKGLRFHHPQGEPMTLQRIAADLGYQVQPQGWRLTLHQLTLTPETGPTLVTRAHLERQADRFRLILPRLNLPSLRPLLPLLPLTPTQRQGLLAADLQGALEGLQLEWHDPQQWQAQGRLADFGARRRPPYPGVSGLDLDFAARPGRLDITLDSRQSQLDLRPLFRQPLELTRLAGKLHWQASDEGWRLESPDLRIDTPDLNSRSRLALRQPKEGKPIIDLRTDFHDGDSRHASRYYPVGIMNPRLVAWLDRAIGAGRIPEGRLILRGPLAHFPFHKSGDGQFEVRFRVEDLTLDYHPQWPPITRLNARVRFHGNALTIDQGQGRLYKTHLHAIEARLASLKPLAPLQLTSQGQGPLADLLRLLRQTPLKKRFGPLTKALQVAGSGQLALELTLPFEEGSPRTTGRLILNRAVLLLEAARLKVSAIEGRLELDEQGLKAEGLHAKALGSPWRIRLTPQEGHTLLQAQGHLDAAALNRHYPFLTPLQLEGRTAAEVAVRLPGGDAPHPLTATIESDLTGLQWQLPSPLAKPAAEALPMALNLTFAPTGRRTELTLGQALQLDLLQPADGGAILDLQTRRLPLREWLDWLARSPADPISMTLAQVHLRTAELQAWPLAPGPMEMSAKRVEDAWRGRIQGQAITGTLDYRPTPAPGLLDLALDHLRLDTQAPPPKGADAEPPVDPRTMPALRLSAKAFELNQANLGKLRLESGHQGDGQRIERLAIEGELASLQGEGDWLWQDGTPFTRLQGRFDTQAMGRFLRQALGLDFLDGSKAHLSFDIQWQGAPYQFELARLKGNLQLDMTAGRFLKIKPGAARILGLLNVGALQRRLQHGFKDVYEQGLAFDTILGRFELDRGQIYTNDLEISAPSGTILIAGSTNLVARTHDQVITVSPRLDATLPLAGALVGGPAAGLAVLVAQQALSSKLEKLQRFRYSVTGSWDAPRVEPLEPAATESPLLDPLEP